MIATGVSARGLDIINVMHVINYDLPKVMHGGINEYIHRIGMYREERLSCARKYANKLLRLLGRTARIGNEGIASSFYNDKDSDIATDLVKVFLECGQTVPDFLEPFRPDGDRVTFEDDVTDNEDESGEKETQVDEDPSRNDDPAPEPAKEPAKESAEEPAEKPSVQESPKAVPFDDDVEW